MQMYYLEMELLIKLHLRCWFLIFTIYKQNKNQWRASALIDGLKQGKDNALSLPAKKEMKVTCFVVIPVPSAAT